jgi:glycosyltransferase involved in cell wall biosynthesis
MESPKNYHFSEKYTVEHLSYSKFLNSKVLITDFIKHGISSSSLYARLVNPGFIQKLYHEKDSGYMAYLKEFYDRFHDFDVIVMNPGVDLVHPEFLYKHFKNSLKCLHFIDDPHLTYNYGFPFLWAFDCATFVSPSYSSDYSMEEILHLAGANHVKWVPHCISNINSPIYNEIDILKNLDNRINKVVYVGNYYKSKTDRLIQLKKSLKNSFDIYGKYPLNGYLYPLLSILKGELNFKRIKTLSNSEREDIYSKYAIGINMHLSTPSMETGNARLYELAYRGVSQVVDSSIYSAVDQIFSPENEILTYENIEECLSQTNRLLNDKDLRIKLAMNAFKKAKQEYSYQKVTDNTFKWFSSLINN